MPDPGQLVSGPAADTLHRAVTRLRRVAMIHASWTVVIALLAASLVSLAGFGVGLLLAALGVAPAMLGTLLPPLLSVAGAMVALGLLILPLLRGRGAVAHAIRLEEATGVTGDLLSAVELHAASLDSGPSSPGDPRVSQELLSEVGRRALDLLAGIPGDQLYPLRRARYLSYATLGTLALVLAGASLAPGAARAALASLLQATEAPRAGLPGFQVPDRSADGVSPPAPTVAGVSSRPGSGFPCEALEVSITDPPYVGGRSRPLPLNGRFRVLAGSRLRVTCRAPFAGAPVQLDLRDGEERTRVPLDLQPGGAASLRVAGEVPVEGPLEVRLLRPLGTGAGAVWHRGVWVFELLPDRPPECWLVEPSGDLQGDRGRVLRVSVEARDDWGVHRILLRYRVLEFDEEERAIELAVVEDRRDVRHEDEVPIASLGAEGGQHVQLLAEVEDGVPGSPGTCRTRPVTLAVRSAGEEFRTLVVRAAAQRDAAVDLLAQALALVPGQGIRYSFALVRVLERLAALEGGLTEIAGLLSDRAMVEQDVVRRLTEMAARLGAVGDAADVCWGLRDDRLRSCLRDQEAALGAELERDVLVLTDVVEGLLNSYLVHWSQELEQQRRHLARLDVKARGDLLRATVRLREKLRQLRELTAAVRPVLPPALAEGTATGGSGAQADWLAAADRELDVFAAGLREGRIGDVSDFLNAIGRSVDEVSRSIEGDYARVLARTTEGFQKRMALLKLDILDAKTLCRTILDDLQAFLPAWEKKHAGRQTERLKRRWVEIRKRIRVLARLAPRMDESAYLPLERQDVEELRTAVTRLRASLSRALVDEAAETLAGVLDRLRSLGYSLELMLRYGGTEEQDRKVRAEQEIVAALTDAAVRLELELRQVLPAKEEMLRPGDRALLDRLMDSTEALSQRLKAAGERVDSMEAAFPALHGRVDVLVAQARRAVSDAAASLQALDLDGAGSMVSYAADNLTGAVVVLEEATRPNRRGAVALASGAGGSAVELPPDPAAELPRLVRMAEQASEVPLPEPWRSTVQDYFRRLLR